jgi:hypothetical protein
MRSMLALCALMTVAGSALGARPKLSPLTSWPPAVRKAFAAVIATPAGQPGKSGEVVKKMLALVTTGAAHDALGALAFSDTLPESHRAISAIWFVQFYRFDPEGLLGLVDDASPFVQRQAIDLLVELGGKELIAKLNAIAVTRPRAGAAIRPRIGRMKPEGKPPFILAQLNTLLRGKSSKKRSMAAVVLSQSKDEAAEWGLTVLLSQQMSALADKTTQIDGALALTRRHASDVPGLVKLTERRNNKFVRYEALKLLAKSAAGKKALRALTLAPDDPMAKERDALVR